MKRSSLLLGLTVSLLSMGALAAAPKAPQPAEKPATTAKKTPKKTTTPTKSQDTKKQSSGDTTTH